MKILRARSGLKIRSASVADALSRSFVGDLDPLTCCHPMGLRTLSYFSSSRAFLPRPSWAYTISQGVSGKLYDRLDTKRGFAGSIMLWSVDGARFRPRLRQPERFAL